MYEAQYLKLSLDIATTAHRSHLSLSLWLWLWLFLSFFVFLSLTLSVSLFSLASYLLLCISPICN